MPTCVNCWLARWVSIICVLSNFSSVCNEYSTWIVRWRNERCIKIRFFLSALCLTKWMIHRVSHYILDHASLLLSWFNGSSSVDFLLPGQILDQHLPRSSLIYYIYNCLLTCGWGGGFLKVFLTFSLLVQWKKNTSPPRTPLMMVNTKNSDNSCWYEACEPITKEPRAKPALSIRDRCMYFADCNWASLVSEKTNILI